MKRTRATSDQSSPAAGTSSDAVSTPHAAASRMEGAFEVEQKRRKLVDDISKLVEDCGVSSNEDVAQLGEEVFKELKTRGLKPFQQLDVQTIQRELQEEKETGRAMTMDNKGNSNIQAGTIGTLNMPQSSSESKDQCLAPVKDLANRNILRDLKSALKETQDNVAHVCQTYTGLYEIEVDPETWEVLFEVMKRNTHLEARNFVDLQILLWNAKAMESVRAVTKKALELEVFKLHVVFLRADPEETNGKEVTFHLHLNPSDFSVEKRGEWKNHIAYLMKIRPDQISIEDVQPADSIWVTVTMPAIVSEALQLKCRDQSFQDALADLYVDQLLFSTDHGEETVEIRSSVSQSTSVEGVSTAAERKRKKQSSDVTLGTRSNMVTSAAGTSEHAALASPVFDSRPEATMESRDLAYFDQVYNRKGKVQVFPDFWESKVTFFKKVTAGKVKGPQGSRKPGTPGNSTERPGGETRHTATGSQQQGRQEEAGVTKKERGRNEPKSFVLDEKKMKDPNIISHLTAEECEFLVVKHIKAALEEIMEPYDPPVFLLHNQGLVIKAKTGKSEGEKDVLVLHPTLGVLILEVKGIERTDEYSRFDKTPTQLFHAQTSIQEEMGDLLEKDAVVLTIALPKLGPEAASVIRKEAEERKRKKQSSDVTIGTRSNVVTSAAGTSEHAVVASPVCDSRSEMELLENHPEILLLCGSTCEVIAKWVRQLGQLRLSAGHAFKGSTGEERLINFKRACIRRLSVAALHPGKSVSDSAALYRRFLLTAEQIRVRDSPADFLHVWGPPGSGKTLLLAERARRWIREHRRVALTVGVDFHTLLLHQLTHTVCGDKADVARVSTHNSYWDLLEWLDTASTADPVFILMDEAWGVDFTSLLHHVMAGRVRGLWSADTADLNDEYNEAWRAVGGTTEQLQLCLRCPPPVMAMSNIVGGTRYPPLLPPPVPVTRELGVGVEVISHADHDQSQPCVRCPTCREGVKNFFSNLGLTGDDVTSSVLSLSDCIVITPGGSLTDTEDVTAFLRGLGLRAVMERIPSTPVLLPGQTPASRDQAQEEAALSHVLSGRDVEGRPVLHVVRCDRFLGLERKVVVVWHRDRNDEVEDRQGQKDRDRRKFSHSLNWFRAMTCCQGRLLLVVATPSPLLSELSASSAVRAQTKPPPSRPLPLRLLTETEQRSVAQQRLTPHSPLLWVDRPLTSASLPESFEDVMPPPSSYCSSECSMKMSSFKDTRSSISSAG